MDEQLSFQLFSGIQVQTIAMIKQYFAQLHHMNTIKVVSIFKWLYVVPMVTPIMRIKRITVSIGVLQSGFVRNDLYREVLPDAINLRLKGMACSQM